MRQLTLWTDLRLPDNQRASLRQDVAPHNLLVAEQHGPQSVEMLAQADVALGQPDPDTVMNLVNLRWVQLTSAGYTAYDRDDLRAALRARGAILTNSSTPIAEPCAQHLLAMMLALARQLPQCLESQLGQRDWRSARQRAHPCLLNGQTALLVGYGAISRRLTQLLDPFKMNLVGVKRSIHGNEPVRMIHPDQIDQELPGADHVIDVLPSSRTTLQFFNADRIAKMKQTAIFYNIGRGDTVDQTALRTALETRSIAAAYLDVMTPEPLPCDEPLWITPNCYITPHIGGDHRHQARYVIEHFVQNLRRFERGEELKDRIV